MRRGRIFVIAAASFIALATETHAARSLTAAKGQATVPLYLTNAALDSYLPRRSSNTAYFGVFEVGTPPKQFTGCFDTGSADAWLPSSACSTLSCTTHDTFNGSASSTFKGSSTSFSVQYATGYVSGYAASDTLTMGPIVVPNQAFGLVTAAGEALAETSCDGIFGFAFPRISQLGHNPPFFNMVAEGTLAQNEFSFWFSADPSEEPAGEMVVGGVNAARYSGIINYVPVPDDTYWAVQLSGATVGSTAVGLTAGIAIIDTGSTAITVGAVDGDAIHAPIAGVAFWPEQGVYNVTGGCSDLSSLPDISFSIGGASYSLPPSLYVIELSGQCISGIIPTGSPNQVVLGVTFLRAWHTTFQYDPTTKTAQLGFATPTTSATATAAGSVATAGRRKLFEQHKGSQGLTHVIDR